MVLDAKLEERTSENNIGDMTREEIVSSSSLAHTSPKVSQAYLFMPCPFTGPKMFLAGPNCPNFFLPYQKFIYILWQSQTFCARQKDDLHSVKLVFVPAQRCTNAVKFLGRLKI